MTTMPFCDVALPRRWLFGAMARAGALAFAGPLASPLARGAAAGRWNPDFEDPRDNLRAYVKMSTSLDPKEVVYGHFSGHVYALVPERPLRPILRLEGFGLGRTLPQPDGSFRALWKEVGYYKDLATGRILESWDNPLGDRTEVLHINNPVVNSTLAPSFRAPGAPQPGPGREIVFGNHSRAADPSAPFVLPWFVNGDTVSVWLDVAAVVPNPLPPAQWPRESTGPTIRIAEQFLLTGRLADLRDPAHSSVPTTGAWNRFGPWLPWMLMGGQPGELFYRAMTRRPTGIDDLPADIVEYTRRRYPQFLVPDVDANRPNESSWEVYKRTRKPAPARGA